MESIWKNDLSRVHFDALGGNKSTDVLIIGGGIAGILCAHRLKNAGVDCMLAEAREICCGITQNTTAKITLQHGAVYDKMIRRFGEKKARLYAEAQRKACREYAKLCENIDCDYETRDSYVYSLGDRGTIEKEVAALKRLGVNAEFSNARELPFSVAGAVRVKDQAQFHPLKFLFSIARALLIYENTKVVELMPHKAKTNHGEITYKKLIIATGGKASPSQGSDGSGYTLTSPEPVPYSWLRQYNLGVASGDFEAAANAASGKTQGGAATSVWEEYVAGTDPTNANSQLKAMIEMLDGAPIVTWEPNLNTNGVVRTYKVYGSETLENGGEWQYPTNSLHRFFKVSVEMP